MAHGMNPTLSGHPRQLNTENRQSASALSVQPFTRTNLRFFLHTNATEQCFVEARRRFDAQLFRESVPHLKELEQALRDHDAALSMGVDVALGTHTVTVFADGPSSSSATLAAEASTPFPAFKTSASSSIRSCTSRNNGPLRPDPRSPLFLRVELASGKAPLGAP